MKKQYMPTMSMGNMLTVYDYEKIIKVTSLNQAETVTIKLKKGNKTKTYTSKGITNK